jgi:hypothetical protein
MEQQQAGCGSWLYDYVPGEHIDVLYFADDAPQVAVDDYVEVSGEESMFSCICQGCCCDACGFIFSPLAPVGGIAELPGISDSSDRNHIALAGLAAAALLALTAGGWYARRRWLR